MQAAVAACILITSAVLALGAAGISAEAGYGGVGPNFLPWVVTVGLGLLGIGLLINSWGRGWPGLETPEADAHAASHGAPDIQAFAWVSAGLISNAGLINYIGFIFSCALCFAFAAQGFRRSSLSQRAPSSSAVRWFGSDLFIGASIAAPVFWMFTKALNVSLPSLTTSGWL